MTCTIEHFFHANLPSVYLFWYTDVMPDLNFVIVFFLFSFFVAFIAGWCGGRWGEVWNRVTCNPGSTWTPDPLTAMSQVLGSALPHLGCWVWVTLFSIPDHNLCVLEKQLFFVAYFSFSMIGMLHNGIWRFYSSWKQTSIFFHTPWHWCCESHPQT